MASDDTHVDFRPGRVVEVDVLEGDVLSALRRLLLIARPLAFLLKMSQNYCSLIPMEPF